MTENHKVSLILPSYNMVEYIEECLKSVLMQTLDGIEVLCIDAGSTDGTLDIIQEYASKDSRISIFQTNKKSYGYQVNLGIREAKGDYIGIVETDDYIEPDMYEILCMTAVGNNADIVKCGRYEVYEYDNSKSIEVVADYIPSGRSGYVVLSPEKDTSVHHWDANVWNALYRRDFLLDNRILFNETPGAAFQDIGFFHLAINEAEKMVYIRNPLYHYRKMRPGASTWNPRCLEYIFVECKTLLDSGRLKKKHLMDFYKWMMPSVLGEYEKAMQLSEFDEERLICPEALVWFENTFRAGIRDQIIGIDDMDIGYRQRLLLFLIDRVAYIDNYRRGIEKLNKWIRELQAVLKGRDLILFGAGNYGTLVAQFLIHNGVMPTAFAENSTWLRNMTMWGIPVWNGDEAAVKFKDAFFLVCSKDGNDEMKKQLNRWGISGEQIGIFDGKDQKLIKSMRLQPILLQNNEVSSICSR